MQSHSLMHMHKLFSYANTSIHSTTYTPTHTGIRDNKPRTQGPVSHKEIERDRGKPLSKYQRNIMIFDWLHALDSSALDTSTQDAAPGPSVPAPSDPQESAGAGT